MVSKLRVNEVEDLAGNPLWRSGEGILGNVSTSTGTQTVAEALDQRGPVFDNVADMQAADNLTVGTKVRTLGYYAPGDGGGNDYEIVSSGTGTDDGGSYIDLSGSGLQSKGLFVNGIVSVGQFGVEPGQDSQSAIQSAVDYCQVNVVPLFWPTETYISTGNIDSFWRVEHNGYGRIERGSDIFYITPVYNYFDRVETNVIYTGSGTSSNDGLTSDSPISPVNLVNVARNIAGKGADGIWRFQFLEGTIQERGLRISGFPVFRNPLEIVGNTDVNGAPSTIWDGTGNVESYALRGDLSSTRLNIRIKDIHFDNWVDGASAIYDGHVEEDNCIVSNTGRVGFWHRTGYHKTTNCHFENIGGDGVRNQYHSSFNVYDCTFDSVNIGVLAGRNASGYIARSTFDNMGQHCISGVMESRIRTNDNIFNSWTTSAIRVEGSTWNDEGSDQFNNLSSGSPAALVIGGGAVPSANHRSERFRNRTYQSTGAQIDEPTVRTSLAELSGFGDPVIVPSWFFYSDTARLAWDCLLYQGSGFQTTIQISGPGDTPSNVLAELTLPATSSTQHWQVEFLINGPRERLPNSDYIAKATGEDGTVVFKRGVTTRYDTTGVRSTATGNISLRAYFQADDNSGSLTLRNSYSYLEY